MKKTCYLFLTILLFNVIPSRAASRYWVSVLGGNWNSTLNWSATSGGLPLASVPGPGDDVFFDGGIGLDVGNCTINAAVSVASLTVSSGYTGTISQGGNIISVAGAASFGGGTFTGGSAAITIGGAFTISATAFTSTTGILELEGNAAFSGGSFSHNNGEVQFNGAVSQTISGASPVFHTLEFVGTGHTTTISSVGNIGVVNLLSLTGASSYTINTGTIAVSGNISLTNTAAGDGGTGTILIDGTTNQSIVSVLPVNESTLPNVIINSTGPKVTFPSMLTVMGNWTYTAGTLDVTTNNSAVVFDNTLTITGTLALNNVTFEGSNSYTTTVSTGTILTVTGTLSITGGFNVIINTPVAGATAIEAQGNITINNTSVAGGGTALILINGTGNQAFTSTAAASQGLLPFITIQKVTGTLTMTGIFSESRSWTYTSGTVDATTNASTVVFGGNNLNITSAGMSFYNVTTTANTSTLTNNMTVKNNLTISGLSVLAPGANTINIAGNWSAWGSTGFSSGTSTVNFNGSALQTITSAGGASFTNLNINNSSTGVQLESNATVTTTLTMTQGNIDLNGGNALALGTASATPGTLNYTAGNIINAGSITRWFPTGAIAGNAGLFPMGTPINNRPLSVVSSVSPTSGGTVTVAYTDAGSTTPVSFADGASTVVVRKDLNWTITTGGGLSGGTYNLTAAGTGIGTIGNVSDLRLTLANSATGTAGVNGGTIGDPQVNTTGLSLANLANTFYISSINAANSPLPVTLLSFTAVGEAGSVVLDWTAVTQMDNAMFTVERSKSAVTWESIGQVAATGTTASSDSYTMVDRYPYSGTSYYRLLQINPDGSQSYSEVRSVSLSGQSSHVAIYPNPAAGFVTVSFSIAGQYEIAVFSPAGQPILGPVLSSGQPVSLAVSSLPAGVYFVRVKSAEQTETKTVLIGKGF